MFSYNNPTATRALCVGLALVAAALNSCTAGLSDEGALGSGSSFVAPISTSGQANAANSYAASSNPVTASASSSAAPTLSASTSRAVGSNAVGSSSGSGSHSASPSAATSARPAAMSSGSSASNASPTATTGTTPTLSPSTRAAPSASGAVPSAANNEPTPSTGCGKTRSLQDGNRTISSGGQNRQYYLQTPSNYDSKHPYRLVFTFHWFYGSIDAVVNPPDADHNTDRPFYGIADLSGDSTVFVAPQGLTDSQAAGWQNPNDRDVKFTDDMLAAISNDLCIDTSRVFTMGFSYGGSMSYELACARADKFRAALLYNPGTLSGTKPASDCTKPIAVFQSHGADDQTLSYSQGLGIFNVFSKLNGCTPATPPMPATNGHTCTSFEGCSSGHPARFCGFGSGENNPHNTSLKGHYPAAKDPGKSSSWVPEEAWAFITQF